MLRWRQQNAVVRGRMPRPIATVVARLRTLRTPHSALRTVLLLVLLSAAAGAKAAPLPGPFTLNDGLTLYLNNPSGAAFDLTVRWQDHAREHTAHPTLVRVFDPEENLLVRHEFAGEKVKPVPWEELKTRVPAGGKGVVQVIVTGWGGAQVEVKSAPALDFGVFGHLQWLTGRKDQFADTYVYLPPGLKRLPVIASDRLESLTLTDEAGAERLRLGPGHLKGEADLPAGEHVWRLSARGDAYRLDFKGLPILLCPNAETARAIRASVDVMPDGSVLFHKHQVAAWKLLQEYRRRPAADYRVEVKPLASYEKAFLKEPSRNQLLFGHYGSLSPLPAMLSRQCLDPKSPWFGAIATASDADGKPRADNPLADYHRAGREEFAAQAKNLAALYWMKEEFNPYYHHPALLHRIIAGVLLDQMVMREGEFCGPDNIYYYGIHAFTFCHAHSGAFSLVYKDVPPDVQRIWHAGQQRYTDRMLYGNVGGCTNQWTILLTALWRYYEGTGEEEYREAVLRNAHWLTRASVSGGLMPAGYMTEASGPDATYNGISGHSLAYLYHRSGDPEILDALRRSFALFNHTIVPEPEGPWLGSSGYCHRTPGDWTSPQYGAGLGPMSSVLPEAGVRYPDHLPWAYPCPATDDASHAAAEAELRKVMHYHPEDYFEREKANYGRALGAFDISFANWRTYKNEFKRGRLPCREDDSFTRAFGNEFLCVKRPAYYAFLYGGRAFGLWQSGGRPAVYNHQFPHNDGLCLFWSPEFGVSLLSKNWGAGQANTLLAGLPGGKTEWPWYWDTKAEFDTEKATAKLAGTVRATPLRYERRYQFLEDRVTCALTVTAGEAVALESLDECLPYPVPDAKPGGLEARLLAADGSPAAAGAPVKAVFFTNAGGKGHLLVLDEPAVVRLDVDPSEDHYGGKHTWGRALISFPKSWAAGQSATLRYTLRPCAAADVSAAVKG